MPGRAGRPRGAAVPARRARRRVGAGELPARPAATAAAGARGAPPRAGGRRARAPHHARRRRRRRSPTTTSRAGSSRGGTRTTSPRCSTAPASTVDAVRRRRRERVDPGARPPRPDAARLRRARACDCSCAASTRACTPPTWRRIRAAGQPLLARRARRRARDARPRPAARVPAPRRRHDRPGEARDGRGQGAHGGEYRDGAGARRAARARGSSPARCASSASPAGAPPSTARRYPASSRDAFGGVPAYVMPNTSGLNARSRPTTSPTTCAAPPGSPTPAAPGDPLWTIQRAVTRHVQVCATMNRVSW